MPTRQSSLLSSLFGATRQAFLRLIVLLLIPLGAQHTDAQAAKNHPAAPVAWWSFDDSSGRETVSGIADTVLGHHRFVEGVRGKALRSDEFETAIERAAKEAPHLTNGVFTVEAWIAPRTYPWNYCPIITQRDEKRGFYFGLNYQGQLQLEASLGGKWTRCESPVALPGLNESLRFAGEGGGKHNTASFGDARPHPSIPLLKWTHVAGTVAADGTLRIYINGADVGEAKAGGAFAQAAESKLVIGRTSDPVLPRFLARPSANAPHFCSFDGLLDEIKIYDHALDAAVVREQFTSVSPANPQPLQFRRMPTAQDMPGAFGAFYTHFQYDEDWDRTRRFGEDQDICVRFENNPCTIVCWNGTMYPIFYPDGGDVGQMYEAFETWDGNGCHEAMMDRQSKHSSWKIVESSPARVVLHWRHALISYNGFLINADPVTGWSDWVDDYYTIYPDTVCARRTTLWSSHPVSNHSYAQDDSVIQPGLMPWDVYEQEPLSIANLAGQETIQTMGKGHHGAKDSTFKGPAVIQRHNFKSRWKPFMIAPPNETFSGEWTNDEPWPWYLPCWHHWPTAQLIDSDGSCTFVENGRPKSSCLTQGWGYGKVNTSAVVFTENSLTRFSLIGMTDQSAASLVGLAKSWREAPLLETISDCSSLGYDISQRAYVICATGASVSFRIAASAEHPIVNPCFVVKNWNCDDAAQLQIDMKSERAGSIFRQGIQRDSNGRPYLVLWLQRQGTDPVTFTLQGAKPELAAKNPRSMTWATVPQATTTTIDVTMAASTLPGNGNEYLFERVGNEGKSAVWQSASVYTDSNLPANTEVANRWN